MMQRLYYILTPPVVQGLFPDLKHLSLSFFAKLNLHPYPVNTVLDLKALAVLITRVLVSQITLLPKHVHTFAIREAT